MCPKHGAVIFEKSASPSPVSGLPGGRWAQGDSVQMPFEYLRPSYEAYLRVGRPRTAFWAPGESPTVYTGAR